MWWPFAEKRESENKESLPLAVDGTVKVAIKPQGIFLRVNAPASGGDFVSISDACKALDDKGIVEVDMSAVREAVSDASGKPVLVAPRKSELDAAGKVEIMVASDQKSAQMQLVPPRGGKKVTLEDVKAALAAKGVVCGIDEALIADAIAKDLYYKQLTVARPTEAVDGEDSKVIYHFLLKKNGKPARLVDGSVDYRTLDLLANVEEGALLASLELATAGVPGRKLSGEILPARDGRNYPLKVGKNVELSEDGATARAKVAGQAVISRGKIDVVSVYQVPGDVDFSTGNIKFNGSVIVRGTVRDGFSVEASGNVQIYGTVEGAVIKSGADVIVTGGVQGQKKAVIEADGNFKARFIDKAKVKARNDIVISEAAMHSELEAGGRVIVESGRGWLVGGVVSAGEEIRARTIGSKLGTSTELRVGVPLQVREELENVQTQLDEASRKLEGTFKAIRLADGGGVPANLDQLYAKLRKTEEELSGQIRQLEEEKHRLELAVQQQNKGVVRASELIHPGVRVTIGRVAYLVRDDISHASLRLEDGEVTVKPY